MEVQNLSTSLGELTPNHELAIDPERSRTRKLIVGLVAGLLLVALMGGGGLAFRARYHHRSGAAAPGAIEDLSGEGRKVVKTKDITAPGGETDHVVIWVNGAYHDVYLPMTRLQITWSDGDVEERTSTDESKMKEQLPPVDPALANVLPNKQQADEARQRSGTPRPTTTKVP